MDEESSSHPLVTFLEFTVPLLVTLLLQHQDEPSEWQVERARKNLRDICNVYDGSMFRGENSGRDGEVAICYAEAITIMAFAPGGIELFKQKFEVKDGTLHISKLAF